MQQECNTITMKSKVRQPKIIDQRVIYYKNKNNRKKLQDYSRKQPQRSLIFKLLDGERG